MATAAVPTPPSALAPSGQFTNPAFILSLVSVVVAVLSVFHVAFGVTLGLHAPAIATAVPVIAAVAAYVSRAVKQHSHGQAWVAYYNALATAGKDAEVVATDIVNDGPEIETDVQAVVGSGILPRTGTMQTTRAAQAQAAKKTATKRAAAKRAPAKKAA